MIEGIYFRTPERPADMEQLWDDAILLDANHLPDWLTVEDIPNYRRLASHVPGNLTPTERIAWERELEPLRERGVIVEESPDTRVQPTIYIKRPQQSERWAIGMYTGASPFTLKPMRGVCNPILTRDDITDVPASFVADPFMIRVNHTWHLFFEVMNWKTYKGEIGHAISTDGMQWHYQQIVLSEPFHLSYPFVFAWQGEYYLIPESHQAGAVRLYRAARFPDRWEYVAPLLEGSYLADATLLRHAERWWMFVDCSPDQEHHTLALFSSDELLGPWQEHPASPLVRNDSQSARPAGRMVREGSQWYRFAQGAVPSYGTDVRAFQIEELTRSTYRERPLGIILGPSEAGWNADGMHHVDAQELSPGAWMACVDGWQMPTAFSIGRKDEFGQDSS